MSIPRNHHFVSQCQIKKFFSDNGLIYLFDKELNRFYDRNSSKGVLSERDSNTIYKDGFADFHSLEHDLKFFEDGYENAVKEILQGSEAKSISNEAQNQLMFLGLFGLTGLARSPQYKQQTDQIWGRVKERLGDALSEVQKAAFDQLETYKKHFPHSNSIKYSDLAFRNYDLMGGLDFHIFHIVSQDVFLLPDTSIIQYRGNLDPAFNPHVRQVIHFGFPISSKLYIHFYSKKLDCGSFLYTIEDDFNDLTEQINCDIFRSAFKTVATSDKERLRHYVDKAQSS